MGIKAKFGQKLKEIRESLKLSQEEFAEKIGISRHSLSELERGINFPAPTTLDSIHENFKIDYNDLFSFDTNISCKLLENVIRKVKMIDKNQLKTLNSFLDALIKTK